MPTDGARAGGDEFDDCLLFGKAIVVSIDKNIGINQRVHARRGPPSANRGPRPLFVVALALVFDAAQLPCRKV